MRRHESDEFFEDLVGTTRARAPARGVGFAEQWTQRAERLPAYETRDYAEAPEWAPESEWGGAEYADETVGTRYFQLRVDADRDGTVDTTDPPTTWTWGTSGKGAVILANFDNDPSGTNPDASDRTIDAGNDAGDDIAPLVIEPVSGATSPAGTRLELSASPANAIRIFASRTAGATEIVGPSAGATHRFTALPAARLELGMEATKYAGSGFDGIVEIKLRTIPPSGTPIEQRTCVRVSPWIMPNHRHAADKVFVVDAGAFNSAFRTELRRLATAAGCSVQETTTGGGGDIWMQDVMEFGVSNLPGKGFRTVFRSKQTRGLTPFPRAMLAPELGFTDFGTPPVGTDSTFDSHGNLEATPAVTVRGKYYRYGRIYYGPGRPGEPFDTEVRAFLRAQIVQDPFEVDTAWLAVGHVDEILSWVPTNATTGKRFKMLIASPRRAYSLLDGLARTNPTARLFVGKSLSETGSPSAECTVTALLAANDDIHPELRAAIRAGRIRYTPGTLRAYNDARQADLDRVKATMMRELELVEADIIEIPSLFMPNSRSPWFADALMPGMVNMLVVNRHCIVPKPFGPVVGGVDKFEEDVRNSLAPLGLTVSFLDCWDTYHIRLGEVHCGTNTLRRPTRGRWWLFQP